MKQMYFYEIVTWFNFFIFFNTNSTMKFWNINFIFLKTLKIFSYRDIEEMRIFIECCNDLKWKKLDW